MPAQAVAAIVYFKINGTLYEHTIDPRAVDSIFLQVDALNRFIGGAPEAAGTSTVVGGSGGPPRRPGVPHHATPEELAGLMAGRKGTRPLAASGGPPPCFPEEEMLRIVDPADVPEKARTLLEQEPDPRATGGCIHCTGCGSWCPD